MGIGLLVIDVQNDYFKGGKMELIGSERALEKIEEVLGLFREKKFPIFHAQHISQSEKATFFLADSEGVQIHSRAKPQGGESLFVKHSPNCFFETELHELLSQSKVNTLVVCGMMSHMCVDTTVRVAREKGFQVIVLEDCCATRDLDIEGERIPGRIVHRVSMASLNGVFAKVLPSYSFHIDKIQELFQPVGS